CVLVVEGDVAEGTTQRVGYDGRQGCVHLGISVRIASCVIGHSWCGTPCGGPFVAAAIDTILPKPGRAAHPHCSIRPGRKGTPTGQDRPKHWIPHAPPRRLGPRLQLPDRRRCRLNFTSKMQAAWSRGDSMLCVGLDPAPARFPASLAPGADRIARFCIEIVDATAPYACAFKPQVAYFAAEGAEEQLATVCAHIRSAHPDIPIILDAKRGDIGATAEQYAREAFERYGADAVTVNPYMGHDSIEPWLEWTDRGVFLL